VYPLVGSNGVPLTIPIEAGCPISSMSVPPATMSPAAAAAVVMAAQAKIRRYETSGSRAVGGGVRWSGRQLSCLAVSTTAASTSLLLASICFSACLSGLSPAFSIADWMVLSPMTSRHA
jgi:hypothetical protein